RQAVGQGRGEEAAALLCTCWGMVVQGDGGAVSGCREAARGAGSPPGGQPASRGQKLNWLMLDLVNTNGGPSRMVLSAPTLNLPSLPAVKAWAEALVIVLEAEFTAAEPGR